MATSPDLRSRLARVKGLGSAHHGAGHWWTERVTSLALIPLCLWFIGSLLTVLMSPNVARVAEWFSSPVNSVLMVLMILIGFVHAKTGADVVIEDYVKAPVAKYALLLLNMFIAYAFAAISVLAVLKLHFLDVSSSM